MKAHKRLMQSLRDITRAGSEARFREWLKRQPGSVRRGFNRGHLPKPAQC